MTVIVYNKYWEYQKIYLDIERVEEKEWEFILYKKGGFSKTFSNAKWFIYDIEE